jgi:hypothetical protein
MRFFDSNRFGLKSPAELRINHLKRVLQTLNARHFCIFCNYTFSFCEHGEFILLIWQTHAVSFICSAQIWSKIYKILQKRPVSFAYSATARFHSAYSANTHRFILWVQKRHKKKSNNLVVELFPSTALKRHYFKICSVCEHQSQYWEYAEWDSHLNI